MEIQERDRSGRDGRWGLFASRRLTGLFDATEEPRLESQTDQSAAGRLDNVFSGSRELFVDPPAQANFHFRKEQVPDESSCNK
jgi:hypothetical protein